MDENKSIVAKNIIFCRKSACLTQAELAEKLNYSDKAVSKWERAEAIPDVFVLKQIADLFNVTVDYLISDHNHEDVTIPIKRFDLKKRRGLLVLISSSLALFVATLVYTILILLPINIPKTWLVFIWALPLVAIINVVFSCIWKSKIKATIFISLLIWSTFIAVCLTVPYYKIWLLLLIAVPLQLLVILWFVYMYIRERAILKEKENLININAEHK